MTMAIRRDSNREYPAVLCSARILLIVVALCAIAARGAGASEQTVDQKTRTALALRRDPTRGALEFSQYCSGCHGSKGHGDAGHAIPALAGQRFTYLVRQLANLAGDQRDSATMHRVLSARHLHDPQAWVDIAAYLNRTPAVRRTQAGDGTKLGLGRGIFEVQCASCHHNDARGDDDGFVPSLRNQHYSYLLLQMNRLSQYDRHNVDENLVQFLRSFDPEEVRAVADYLSRLRGPGNPRNTTRKTGVRIN
jgi:cytochrome c553